MKRCIITFLSIMSVFIAEAKPWPSDALSQIKRNQGIQVDCSYLSAMLGRDMSYEYPQRLLESYKSYYPDYAKFEDYTLRHRYTSDPIRVNLLKSYVRNCSFSAVWRILERNSPVVERLRNESPSKYNQLKNSTISKLQSKYGTVVAFTEALCLKSDETSAALENITAAAANEINNSYSGYSNYSGHNNSSVYNSSVKITCPSNSIVTDTHIWSTVSIETDNGITYVQKKVTPRAYQTIICSGTDEFIEDAETGRKYYLISSSIPLYPQNKILTGTSTYHFTETYPELPSHVRYINISSGNQYYIKNLRIR